MNTITTPSGPPLAVSIAVDQKTPMQREFIALCNGHRQLRNEKARPAVLEASVDSLYQQLEKVKQEGLHDNPEWLELVLEGQLYYATGDIEGAIEFVERSKEKAKDPIHLGKSLNNGCEYKRQAGHIKEAVRDGQQACAVLGGTNRGALITWAEALYDDGQKEKADTVLRGVASVSNINHSGDVLGTYLRYEDKLRAMFDLPIVAELLGQVK